MDERQLKMLMTLLGREENTNSSATWEEAEAEATAFNAMLSSGLTFQSLLPSATSAASSSLMPLPFSQFAQDTLTAADPSPTPILRFPKNEPISSFQDYVSTETDTNTIRSSTINPFHQCPPDLNLEFFIPTPPTRPPPPPPPPPHDTNNDYSSIFNHLPDLLSLDPSSYSSSSTSSSASSQKRPRHFYSPSTSLFSHPPHPQYPLFQPNNTTDANLKRKVTPSPSPPPRGSSLARSRRQTLSDKTRCLQKLLPWDKRMDTATTLQEACKYIKFLQAQAAALWAMPVLSANKTASTFSPPTTACGSFGGLERLSRNQFLQVLLNSSVAQSVICSKEFCVFSAEQLGLLSRRFRTARSSSGSDRLLRHPHPHFFPGSSYSSAN